MVRNARTWFEGAKFHVTSRGIRRSSLFFEDEDYEKYLVLLEEIKVTYPFVLQSYCLMTNHTHLQITMQEIPLSSIMKNLNTKYAKYFNKKYQFTGHVFEKRYRAELLNSVEYEIDVSKYIHLNPVKASMVEVPEEYPWSSYRFYIQEDKYPLIDPAPLLAYFPAPEAFHYQHYMRALVTDKYYWAEGKLFFYEREGVSCGQK